MADLLDRDFVKSILSFGGSSMLNELLVIFGDSAPGRLTALQELAHTDPEGARRAAHALRSSGSNIGAAGFADLARMIEVESSDEEIPAKVESLVALYSETVDAFEALAAQQAS
ncbi:MAG: HPt (histidine-containing phosphotransfer) domain-containing protein [Rhodothermales bacterium]